MVKYAALMKQIKRIEERWPDKKEVVRYVAVWGHEDPESKGSYIASWKDNEE